MAERHPPVAPEEKRFVLPDGAARGFEVLLVKRAEAGDVHKWWSFRMKDGRPQFGIVNLRNWHQVKRDKEDGVIYIFVAGPSDEEWQALPSPCPATEVFFRVPPKWFKNMI